MKLNPPPPENRQDFQELAEAIAKARFPGSFVTA
jgi:hypothetical protein